MSGPITKGTVYSLGQVWDPNLLTYVPAQQATLEADSVTVALPDEGQQSMAESISVAIADDQTPIPVSLSGGAGQSDTEARAYQTATGTITASGQSIILALNGAKGASVDFVDSSFNGAFKFYVKQAGSQYIETQALNIYGATGGEPISNPLHSAVAGNRIWSVVVPPGTTHVKVNAESGSSGSCAVTISGNNGNSLIDYAIGPSDEGDSGRPLGGVLMMVRHGTKGVKSPRCSANRYEANFGGLVTLQNTVTTNNLYVDTTVADSASSVTLCNQNVNRVQLHITNTSSAILYVKLGSTASATSFAKRLQQWETWSVPEYWIGVVSGIWATDPNDGVAIIQEIALV